MYKLTLTDVMSRLADGAHIPSDPRNGDRQKYDEWVAAGGVPLPADPLPQPDPRLVLDAAELAEAKVDAAILALVNAPPAERVIWARNNFPTLTLAEQNRLGMILNILAVAARPHVR